MADDITGTASAPSPEPAAPTTAVAAGGSKIMLIGGILAVIVIVAAAGGFMYLSHGSSSVVTTTVAGAGNGASTTVTVSQQSQPGSSAYLSQPTCGELFPTSYVASLYGINSTSLGVQASNYSMPGGSAVEVGCVGSVTGSITNQTATQITVTTSNVKYSSIPSSLMMQMQESGCTGANQTTVSGLGKEAYACNEPQSYQLSYLFLTRNGYIVTIGVQMAWRSTPVPYSATLALAQRIDGSLENLTS